MNSEEPGEMDDQCRKFLWFLFRTMSARWVQRLAGERAFATQFGIALMGALISETLNCEGAGKDQRFSAERLCKTLLWRGAWFEDDILVVA